MRTDEADRRGCFFFFSLFRECLFKLCISNENASKNTTCVSTAVSARGYQLSSGL